MRPAVVLAVAALLAVLAGTCAGFVGGFVAAHVGRIDTENAGDAAPGRASGGDSLDDADADVPWTGAALGVPAEVVLDADVRERHLRYVVPPDAVSVTVIAESAHGSIRLSARFSSEDGEPWDADTSWEGLDADSGEVCRLDLAAASMRAFRAGALEVCILADHDPEDDRPCSVSVRAVPVRGSVDARIPVGSARDSETSADGGFRRQFEVEFPPDGGPVRIDVSGAAADLDLFASFGGPILPGTDADVRESVGLGAAEWLVLGGEGDDPPAGGRVWVVVTDPSASPFPVPFRIHVTAGEEPPAELRDTLPLPQPGDPRELALVTVVEILTDDGGGSGTIVSPDGLVLTAYHVVEGAARAVAAGRADDAPRVVVAVTLDPREVARDMFVAEVVHGDHGLDLAMLRITGNVRNVPLPDGYRFPSARMSRRSLRMLGEALFTVGYPLAGGMGTRVTQTVSRGVVSGYARAAKCREIKTDAFVSPGSSGGAAFDDRWEFVGVPVSTTNGGDDHGLTLGNVVPADAVPAEWWK